MIYLVVAYLLTRRLRLAIGPTLLVLLAGTVPVMTFIVERWVYRKYIVPAGRGRSRAAAARQPGRPLRIDISADQHYYTEEPGRRAPARAGARPAARSASGAGDRRRGVLGGTAGSRHPDAAGHRARSPGLRRTCWISAAVTGRWPWCWRSRSPAARSGRSTSTGGRWTCARATRPGRAWATCAALARMSPGLPGQAGRDLVQPAAADRQAGPARAARPDGLAAGPWRHAPTWSCSGTSDRTRCTAGWRTRAGRSPGSARALATVSCALTHRMHSLASIRLSPASRSLHSGLRPAAYSQIWRTCFLISEAPSPSRTEVGQRTIWRTPGPPSSMRSSWATSTWRPTCTPRQTVSWSPSTTTVWTGSPTAPAGSRACPTARWRRRASAAVSASRCSRTCSPRGRTQGSTSM